MRRKTVGGLAMMAAAALAAAACSGSGPPRPTPAPTVRVPSVAEISALVGQGFIGEKIPYTTTLISAFRNRADVVAQVEQCGAPAPADKAHTSDYWPVLLGHCFFAGNATMRLYQYTNRSEFLDANRLLERLHQARLAEARADGAQIAAPYWQMVKTAIYDTAYNPAQPSPSAATPARGP
ncbi:MAG: hypothetical protein ACYDEB_14680 [Dehalococcoidia bacterium]